MDVALFFIKKEMLYGQMERNKQGDQINTE